MEVLTMRKGQSIEIWVTIASAAVGIIVAFLQTLWIIKTVKKENRY
jgi:hypothetical protein